VADQADETDQTDQTDEATGRARRRWWRTRSVRARITVLATVAVAVFLALGSVGGVRLVTYVLERAADDRAHNQAVDIAALVRADRLPSPVPAGAGAVAVQVLDGAGRVLGASAGGDRLTSLVAVGRLAELRAGNPVTVAASRLGNGEALQVVGLPADTPSGARTVLVAVPADQVDRTAQVLAVAAVIGSALATAAFAASCWLVTGWALRPVTVLRRSASRITNAGTGRRLALPAADDEIRALAVTLNSMLGRLATSALQQRAFVADAAHELRSPLSSLRVQLEVEARHPDTAGREHLVRDLLAEVDRLEHLTSDLLELARLEAVDTGTTADTVDTGTTGDCADLLSVATDVLASFMPPDGVTIALSAPRQRVAPAGPVVRGDRDGVRAVVRNLVDNAARYATSCVDLEVGVQPESGPARRVSLVIRDDGPGIDETDRARVFDRFTRLDSARSRGTGGSGLGLSIVARTLRAQDASIELSDAAPSGGPTRGLRVVVTWPAVDQPVSRPGE